MSDEELIARLREASRKRDEFEAVMLAPTAADRIETLVKERDAASVLLRDFIAAWDKTYLAAAQADAREEQLKAIEAAAQPTRKYLGAKP